MFSLFCDMQMVRAILEHKFQEWYEKMIHLQHGLLSVMCFIGIKQTLWQENFMDFMLPQKFYLTR